VQHGMIKPKFDPSLAIGDGVSTLGRRQLSRGDRNFIVDWLFRAGTTPKNYQVAFAPESHGAANVTPTSNGVSPDASATDGDSRSGYGILHQPRMPVGRDTLPAEKRGVEHGELPEARQ
jgi:hypothetical protein